MRSAQKLGLVLAAAAVGAVAGIAVLERGGDETDEPRAGSPFEPGFGFERTMTVEPSITPRTHLFGDAVTAEAELTFDPSRVDPDTVRVEANFDPYQQVGEPRRLRTNGDELVRLRYSYTLRCVAPSCAPVGARKQTDMPVGQVVYRLGRERIVDTFDWPSIRAASRLGPIDLEQARWRADVSELPDVSYRVSPGLLGASLGSAAVLLALVGGALGVFLLPTRSRSGVEEEAPAISALERALAAVGEISMNGATPEQRKALERLARELGHNGLSVLATRTRQIAWSADHPRREDLEALREDVEAEIRTNA